MIMAKVFLETCSSQYLVISAECYSARPVPEARITGGGIWYPLTASDVGKRPARMPSWSQVQQDHRSGSLGWGMSWHQSTWYKRHDLAQVHKSEDPAVLLRPLHATSKDKRKPMTSRSDDNAGHTAKGSSRNFSGS